jgi:hypothetical protein
LQKLKPSTTPGHVFLSFQLAKPAQTLCDNSASTIFMYS